MKPRALLLAAALSASAWSPAFASEPETDDEAEQEPPPPPAGNTKLPSYADAE